jgi:membrane-associated phospholipid phosphatase
MSQTVRSRVVPRPVRPAGWWFDGLLLAGFVGLTGALAAGHLLRPDVALADWLLGTPEPVRAVAALLNNLGQGGKLLTPLTLLLAGWLVWRVKSVRPLLLPVAAFAVTFCTIGPLKWWSARPAPSAAVPGREQFFHDQLPFLLRISYPSGHVVNAFVWYGAIAVLVAGLYRAYARRLPAWVPAAIVVAPPVILFVTTTVLRYHWITDSIAGVLLGWLLHRLLARVPWDDLPLPRLGGWERPAGLHPPR